MMDKLRQKWYALPGSVKDFVASITIALAWSLCLVAGIDWVAG